MGKARFDRNRLAVELEMRCGIYSVGLEQCVDSAGMLDSILLVAGHRDCTPEILFDFIKCLDEACLEMHGVTAQVLFCPCGLGRKVRWRSSCRKIRSNWLMN